MKRHKLLRPTFIIALCLLVIFLLPIFEIQRLRGATVAFFAPIWSNFTNVKQLYISSEIRGENDKLLLENHLLKGEVARLNDQLHQSLALQTDLVKLEHMSKEYLDKDAFFQRRYEELQHAMDLQLKAISADVIFRKASTWNDTLWINVGLETNEKLGRLVVEKNSPVIKESAVVGVVEYVGKKQSLVRLISDPKLHPSVRVARDFDGFWPKAGSQMLAKGELCGLIPSKKGLLRGCDFNYDFADEEGPARELLFDPAIIQVGDLLVTSGMDGIFPSGLPVGHVAAIDVLKEGYVTFDIEVAPICNFHHLERLFVLPSLGFDPN